MTRSVLGGDGVCLGRIEWGAPTEVDLLRRQIIIGQHLTRWRGAIFRLARKFLHRIQ
jgi:hypothetical protein